MTPAPASPGPPLDRLLRPAALALMAACLALPLTQLIASLAPAVQTGLLLAAGVLAALEANFSFGLLRRRFISGGDLWRFRLAEYGLFFIAIRAASLALNGWPPELAGPGPWPSDPRTLLGILFDLDTLLALTLAIFFASAVTDTLTDLDRVGEPPIRERGYVSPLDSLTTRFYAGGALLLALSGLARIGLADLLSTDRPPVTGLVLNVLVYFLVGLLLLGRVNLALMSVQWQARGLRVSPELSGRWTRYSLAFIGLACLLAFALPTGYTSGALGLVGRLLFTLGAYLWVVAVALFGIFMVPFAWMVSLLRTEERMIDPVPEPLVPPPVAPPPLPPDLPAWLEALRPLLVWGLVIGMLVYIVVNYVRDRPEMIDALRRLRWVGGLKRLWAALRHRASGLKRALQARSPAAWLRQRQSDQRLPLARFFRVGGASPRQQIMYYYLSTLQRAAGRGVARRPAQSARDFSPLLSAYLPDAADDVDSMTAAFEEARYTDHPLLPEQAGRAKEAWRRLRARLHPRARTDKGNKNA